MHPESWMKGLTRKPKPIHASAEQGGDTAVRPETSEPPQGDDALLSYEAAPSETQIYRGYSQDDLTVFNRFSGQVFQPVPGFITDFLGVRTRVSFHSGMSAPQGMVLGIPIPNDNIHAETVEWIGLLKSVLTARNQFVCMELGAGWGPWIVGGAMAAQRLGTANIHLTGVEADLGHFEFMQDHLRDNGLDPRMHNLLQAAVGVKSGRARWPKCADPASDWGSRPSLGAVPAADHLGRVFDTWVDIKVRSFRHLLLTKPIWDLVHIDVQGWEADLCRSAEKLLDQRVRWMVVATHDPKLHGDVMQHLHARGWDIENEKPPRLNLRSGSKSLQQMSVMDGTQVWRNPRF